MILDEQALFSDKQAITGTAVSTNVIKTGGDIAKGTPVEIVAQVVEAIAGATSVQVVVQTCDTENGTYTDLVKTDAVAVANLVAGYQFALKFLPRGIENFIRLNYVVVGTPTAGKITAGIVDGSPESYHN